MAKTKATLTVDEFKKVASHLELEKHDGETTPSYACYYKKSSTCFKMQFLNTPVSPIDLESVTQIVIKAFQGLDYFTVTNDTSSFLRVGTIEALGVDTHVDLVDLG